MQKNEQINQVINKICESDLFSESPISCDLLKYLIQATINNEKIKELNIAFDVFQKGSDFDPSSDATVRVNIHNLRNRLNSYYVNEGKNDPLKISIPKGHYYVNFTKSTISRRQGIIRYSIPLIIVFMIVLFTVGPRLLKINNSDAQFDKNNFILNSFLNSSHPTMIVLGNYYFMTLGVDSLTPTYIRNIEINSDKDLEKYRRLYPGYSQYLEKTNHTFFTKDIPFSLKYILPPFYLNGKTPEIKLSSDFILDDLKQNNIIFIGSYKNLGVLHPLLTNLNIEYLVRENVLTISLSDSSKVKSYRGVYNSEEGLRTDYCLIAKVPLYEKNSALLFLSIHDIGNISSVKKFTDPEFLETFKQINFPEEEDVFFYCLVEVKGLERTDLGFEIIYLKQIDPGVNMMTDIL